MTDDIRDRIVDELRRMKPKPDVVISFWKAAAEIAVALGDIPGEAPSMVLYGLCATGSIRFYDGEGGLVDFAECTVDGFQDKPHRVSVEDVRHWLEQWSAAPLSGLREGVILELLKEGKVPGRGGTIKWKPFLAELRRRCNVVEGHPQGNRVK
jgi:hypothetical protein